jgi:protein arginine kinase activator
MNPVCERCGERPASVHLTQIINGQKSELNLCEQCAAAVGPFPGGPQWHVGHLLGTLLPPAREARTGPAPTGPRCSRCGWTPDLFQGTGRFGCDECYQAFQPYLEDMVRRIHGSAEHRGKIPARQGGGLRRRHQLTALRAELSRAIQTEAFEEAARIRDEIRRLEQEVAD